MIKFVTLLAFAAVVWVSVIADNTRPIPASPSMVTPSPQVVQISVTPETLGLTTDSADQDSWKTYISSKMNFSFKYPGGLQPKTLFDGSVDLSQGSLSISFSQHKMSGHDTVNTIAEKDINSWTEKLDDQFRLAETISPIAIGAKTGITFTTVEFGREVTYFYIPQGFTYLVIANKTQETADQNLISLSDDIIYSLDLLER